MATPSEIASASPEETEAAGEPLGRAMRPRAGVALIGELGARKTCFIQGVVRGLGAAVRATSPTFVLVNQYKGRVPVYHVDAYRTQSLTELIDLGLLELMSGEGVTLIEWADKLPSLLPPDAIHVSIRGVGDEPRQITIRA